MSNRLTSEMAAVAVGRYDLVLIAARRVRELRDGYNSDIAPGGSDISIALQEIEEGKVGREYLLKNPNIESEKKRKAR